MSLIAAASAAAVPSALAGGLLISDGSSVLRFHPSTGALLDVFTPEEGSGMGSPSGLTLRSDGTVGVADMAGHSISSHDLLTGAFTGTIVPPNSGGLSQPQGLAYGPDGKLYVCSAAGNAILRYHGQTGAFIDTFVVAGSGGLSQPWGLTFGPDGHLYVSSAGSNNILRYHGLTGASLDAFVVAGAGGLSTPQGLVFGADGHLYVSSRDNHQVLRYDGATGAFLDVFVGSQGGGLLQPSGLTFAADGQLYVCSAGTSSILRFNGQTGASLGALVPPATDGLGQPQSLLFAPPAAPGSLSAAVVSATRVNLTWTDTSDVETAFAIWRRTGTGAFVRIAVVPENVTSYSDTSASASTSYTYRVRTVSVSGGSAWSNEVGATTPADAPAAPTGLTGSAISTSRVQLSWTDNSHNETAFAIWRKTGAGAWGRIAVVVPDKTSYSDTSVSPNTGYTYRVRATNNSGASAWTSEVPVTTPDAPPAAPSGLTLGRLSANRIALFWTDNSHNETAFAIWRKTGAGDWTRIAVCVPDDTDYVDAAASASTTYTYRVRATNNFGASAWTGEVSATTPPAAPTGLAVSVVSATLINLSWVDNSSDETAFAIWRKTGAGAWERIAVVVPNTTSYADTTVSAGTTYTYRLRSIGLAGASDWSSEVSGTTP